MGFVPHDDPRCEYAGEWKVAGDVRTGGAGAAVTLRVPAGHTAHAVCLTGDYCGRLEVSAGTGPPRVIDLYADAYRHAAVPLLDRPAPAGATVTARCAGRSAASKGQDFAVFGFEVADPAADKPDLTPAYPPDRPYARVLAGPLLDLDTRLAVLNAANGWEVAARSIDARIARDGDGEYLPVNGYKVYYEPDWPVRDRDQFREGMVQVLTEIFALPNLFHPLVRAGAGDVVLDLGANIGTTALVLAEAVGPAGTVYAVEPVVTATLEKNRAVNGLGNVVVVPEGVYDAPGSVDIAVTDFLLDSSVVRADYGAAPAWTKTIPLTTVDELADRFALTRLDFVKMDIEGAEEQALRGAAGVVRRFRPKWSISSYHTDRDGDKQHPKLVKLLTEFGYRVIEEGAKHIYAY
jgi:FkbM family methyltransferase